MPTYEYKCTQCSHEWEMDQSIKDEPAAECPACHGQTAKRQISAPAFGMIDGNWTMGVRKGRQC